MSPARSEMILASHSAGAIQDLRRPDDGQLVMFHKPFGFLIHAAGAITWDAAWHPAARGWNPRASIQTGGPDDDDDREAALVRKLVPIVAIIILIAVVFGN
jgi:hypothetical protein